jgi:hypothetical protein
VETFLLGVVVGIAVMTLVFMVLFGRFTECVMKEALQWFYKLFR